MSKFLKHKECDFEKDRIIISSGKRKYYSVWCPCHPKIKRSNYVLEHRLLIEMKLERFLNYGEVVHHIDGNGLNNSLDNLEVLTIREHKQRHKKLKRKD